MSHNCQITAKRDEDHYFVNFKSTKAWGRGPADLSACVYTYFIQIINYQHHLYQLLF